jgi:uncharacterized protein (TIGR03435 family)
MVVSYVLLPERGVTAVLSQDARGSVSVEETQGMSGTWQGYIQGDKESRVIVKITKQDGAHLGVIVYYIDSQTPSHGTAAREVSVAGAALRFYLAPMDARYEGKMSSDGSSIDGTLRQGEEVHPLKLSRAKGDVSSLIPKAEGSMPVDARPQFEVATIKPSDPANPGSGIHVKGRHFTLRSQTVNGLISFAYSLHESQVVNGPSWLGTDRYDIDGVPDIEGAPNLKQMQNMIQALLDKRFALRFHKETRRMEAFVLSLRAGGPRLTVSVDDPQASSDQRGSARGMRFTNMTMAELAFALQLIVSRPVVDQTGLTRKYDFSLKWTPESSNDDSPDAPPGLYTAIQEQLGLKLTSKRIPVDVIVIDKVERPTSN